MSCFVIEAIDPLRYTTKAVLLLRREVQIHEALAQRADELGDVATLFKWGLDHDARGNITEDFVEYVVAQIISGTDL